MAVLPATPASTCWLFLLAVEEPIRQVYLCHGEAELGGHLLPPPGRAEHDVSPHGKTQLRERR